MNKEDIHSYQRLDPENVIRTINLLNKRIEERFPNSGLSKACKRLLDIARVAEARSEWISRPIYLLRAGVVIVILAMMAIAVMTIMNLKMGKTLGLFEFIQTLEPGLNVLVLIGVAVFFLVSIEARIKRGRTLKAIHELRVIVHIIDMHQLTKDPEQVLGRVQKNTASSPKRKMTPFELNRYLDYCSEMLALTGKIATLYIQNFNDSIAITSVNEVESLANSIARKIWQKLVILNSRETKEKSAPENT